jgi:hypothetical protein
VPVRDISLDGRVSGVAGSCPIVTFTLEGRSVYTTATTAFQRGPCRDLRNGTRIEMRGFVMSDNRVRADVVRFEDDDDNDDDDEE